jgi:beta-phosphoglucomutase-like phosphatase (HAD superfamily)
MINIKEVDAVAFDVVGTLVSHGQLVQGAKPFIDKLSNRLPGRLALVSSASERYVNDCVMNFTLGGYFDPELVVSSDTVYDAGLSNKPSPDPYKFVINKLDAKRLLAFEDTVSGAQAAKDAGAVVIGVNASSSLRNSGLCEAIVDDYDDAAMLLGVK